MSNYTITFCVGCTIDPPCTYETEKQRAMDMGNQLGLNISCFNRLGGDNDTPDEISFVAEKQLEAHNKEAYKIADELYHKIDSFSYSVDDDYSVTEQR